MSVVSNLAAVMVEEDVACAEVFEVSDLKAVRISDFLRLEGRIDGIHLNYGFRLLSL